MPRGRGRSTRVPQSFIDKRQDVVASLLGRGMRQSEILAQISTEFLLNTDGTPRHDASNNPIPNPTYLVNPNTKKPYDKATISRDVEKLSQQWRDRAALNTDILRAEQYARSEELYRVALAKKDERSALEVLKYQTKLLGTALPEKHEVRWDDEQIGQIDRLKSLFQEMRQSEGANGRGDSN